MRLSSFVGYLYTWPNVRWVYRLIEWLVRLIRLIRLIRLLWNVWWDYVIGNKAVGVDVWWDVGLLLFFLQVLSVKEKVIHIDIYGSSFFVLSCDQLTVDGMVNFIVIIFESVFFIAESLIIEFELFTVHKLQEGCPGNKHVQDGKA